MELINLQVEETSRSRSPRVASVYNAEANQKRQIQKMQDELDFLRTNPHLDCRDPIQKSINERIGKNGAMTKVIEKKANGTPTSYPRYNFVL